VLGWLNVSSVVMQHVTTRTVYRLPAQYLLLVMCWKD